MRGALAVSGAPLAATMRAQETKRRALVKATVRGLAKCDTRHISITRVPRRLHELGG